MFKINGRKIYVSLILVLAVSLVIAFPAPDSFAQKGGKGRYRKVPLTKGAKKNGYTVTQHGRDEYLIQIEGAEDPKTKKKLEGKFELEYRCSEKEFILRSLFRNGLSDRKRVECLILLTPRILIQEEPD